MKKLNKIIFTILIVLVFLFGLAMLTGCSTNPPAERFAKLSLEFRHKIIIENPNLSANEKELLLIQLLQCEGYSQKEINAEIEHYHNRGDLLLHKHRELQTRKE